LANGDPRNIQSQNQLQRFEATELIHLQRKQRKEPVVEVLNVDSDADVVQTDGAEVKEALLYLKDRYFKSKAFLHKRNRSPVKRDKKPISERIQDPDMKPQTL